MRKIMFIVQAEGYPLKKGEFEKIVRALETIGVAKLAEFQESTYQGYSARGRIDLEV